MVATRDKINRLLAGSYSFTRFNNSSPTICTRLGFALAILKQFEKSSQKIYFCYIEAKVIRVLD
jgi:hypothetical protein